MKHKVFGYGRASTDKQLASPEVQRFTIEKWFQEQKEIGKLEDFEWGGFYCDPATSAKIPWFQRKGAQAMLVDAKPGDYIVAALCDRAIRSTLDACQCLEELSKFELKVKFLDNPMIDTTTIDGEMLFKILSAVAERERQMISKRNKEHYAWARENGLPINGKAPCGWRVVKDDQGRPEFATEPYERKLAEYVVHLKNNEGLSYDQVYFRMKNEKIILPNTGKEPTRSWCHNAYQGASQGWPHPSVIRDKNRKKLKERAERKKRKELSQK